ncbi:hypothetical protein ACFQ4O_05915 [Methylopila musalis]|uniref:Uncharacterized protein n=1 Tax=Methylopila musalis TaxID=1134781 RepID=A0ABW3Z753_9HYPH
MSARALILAASVLVGVAPAVAGVGSDYSTVEKTDYIIGCMAANGQTRQALERCACSIDTIAEILPHDEYEQAETILRMNKIAGQSSEVFRTTGMFDDIVANMRRAQAEAEIKCFP